MKTNYFPLVLFLLFFQSVISQTKIIDSQPITGTIGYSVNSTLQYASGTYSVWKANSNPGIRKPIIIVEGWDPLNQYLEDDIYTLFNNNKNLHLSTQLHSQGYDIIILNFDDGADYIQKNAFLLIKLIQDINAMKNANGSTEPNVVKR